MGEPESLADKIDKMNSVPTDCKAMVEQAFTQGYLSRELDARQDDRITQRIAEQEAKAYAERVFDE